MAKVRVRRFRMLRFQGRKGGSEYNPGEHRPRSRVMRRIRINDLSAAATLDTKDMARTQGGLVGELAGLLTVGKTIANGFGGPVLRPRGRCVRTPFGRRCHRLR